MRDHLIAVDVGTGSARAGVVAKDGRLLARREHPILLSRPSDHSGEYSSRDIWAACCIAVRSALAASGVPAAAIAGLGFDATCSLVLLDRQSQPLCLNPDAPFDTIAWLDHRATAEAEECGRIDHPVLAHNGGALSPEAEIPKLMWLKRQRPELWARLGHAFDLADFLTWKATGSTARSISTLTSKWTFFGHAKPGWQQDFLDQIGLEDLVARAGLPEDAVAVGKPVGMLSLEAAEALGLDAGIPVASGMVDAYAGALGVLGSTDLAASEVNHVALIGGTSSCLIALKPQPFFGYSLWGPYYEAVFPDLWLVEAGQSATGDLLNHILRSHVEGGDPSVDTHRRVIARIQELRALEGPAFGEKINVLPDFHGNRSPFADPSLTGTISGLTLDRSFDGLCRLYWRACVAIVLGLRQIVETLADKGVHPIRLHLTGGHVKNPLLVELYADATGCEFSASDETDAVLVGTAINAASAAGLYPGLVEAGRAMAEQGRPVTANLEMKGRYDRDYARFLAMQRHRAELNAL